MQIQLSLILVSQARGSESETLSLHAVFFNFIMYSGNQGVHHYELIYTSEPPLWKYGFLLINYNMYILYDSTHTYCIPENLSLQNFIWVLHFFP